MANPTQTITRNFKADVGRVEVPIKNGVVLTVGAFVAIDKTIARLDFMEDNANLVPAGILVGQAQGDNTNLIGDVAGSVSAIARGGIVLEKVSVIGVSAVTDRLKLVYATDGQTLTLTPAVNAEAVGYIDKWISGTVCDVYLFSPAENKLNSMIP